MAKRVNAKVIKRQIELELGLTPADMTIERGGFTCSEVLWDMVPVVLISRAYEGTEPDGTRSNMVEGRPLHQDLKRIAALMRLKGHHLHSYDEARDLFFVVPDSRKDYLYGL